MKYEVKWANDDYVNYDKRWNKEDTSVITYRLWHNSYDALMNYDPINNLRAYAWAEVSGLYDNLMKKYHIRPNDEYDPDKAQDYINIYIDTQYDLHRMNVASGGCLDDSLDNAYGDVIGTASHCLIAPTSFSISALSYADSDIAKEQKAKYNL